jgi:hypothetical protein
MTCTLSAHMNLSMMRLFEKLLKMYLRFFLFLNRKLRRLLTTGELRRLARTPTKKSSNKALPDSTSMITVMPAAAAALAVTALVIPPPRSPVST